ncbi:hypothetical protein BDV93DRAFT_606969 [Ceratobasidium sp. AG-I]|nr:hypothetical protein BDV93DRAFT_606969 [Ceratobasidium sp. AG-I]
MAKHTTRPALVTDLRKLLAQQNPTIPLYFESTQEKMTAFKSALTTYVTSGQAEITRRREKYDTLQRRERDKTAKMNAEIEQFRVDEMSLMKSTHSNSRLHSHASNHLLLLFFLVPLHSLQLCPSSLSGSVALKKEQEEKSEAEAKLAEYNAQFKDVEENRAAVDLELEGLRARAEKLRIEKSQDVAKLERQVALNEPEARALEDALKWSVEGIERDILKIKFTHLDEANPAREFSFVIDLSERRYKVSTSSPLLPQMSALVEWLNETREFYWFVKKVRKAFQQYVQDERRALRAA